MNLYIILKDGKPYITNSDNKPYVKAYYDKKVAERTVKSFCTSEANTYYSYGEGSYQLEREGFRYPEVMKERNKRAKKLTEEWILRWEIREVSF